MPAGLPLAIALLAGMAGTAAAPDPGPPKPAENPAAADPVQPASAADRCGPPPATIEPGEIFVCAPRPQGYRINPDVMEAKRAMRSRRAKPPETMRDNSCASVGPAGCMGAGAGIDLIGGAILAATMAARAARGENVGKMFVTDPQRSEYEYYVEAKRIREEKEAEAALAAKAKAKAAEVPPGQ